MNHPSEWQRIYHPKYGKKVYRHKGTGVITDSLWKIGKVLKKPLVNLAKKVAEKGIQKASDVAVKKVANEASKVSRRAGDKIGSILRNRNTRKTAAKSLPSTAKSAKQTRREEMMMLNNLLSQL